MKINSKFGVFGHHSTHFRPRAGFTLIELLMVIAIIGILASLTIISLRGAGVKARDTKAKSNAANVDKALGQYEIDNGQLFPSAVTQTTVLLGLASLVPNYLKTNAALTPATGQDTGYISNYSRTSYAQAWELENTTEAAVSSGNGIYGTNSANASGVVATPAKGSAISFNGTSTNVTITDASTNANNLHSAAFSVSFWAQTASVASGTRTLVHKTNGLTGWRVYLSCNNINCTVNADYQGSLGGPASGPVANPLTTGSWYHIVATFNNTGTVTTYVNGNAGNTALISFTNTNNNSIVVGGSIGALGFLSGTIDDLRLYNKVLNLTEVGYLYNLINGIGYGSYGSNDEIAISPNRALLSGWRFDEGTSTSVGSYSSYTFLPVNVGTTNGTWTAGNAPLGLTAIGSSLTGKAFVTYR